MSVDTIIHTPTRYIYAQVPAGVDPAELFDGYEVVQVPDGLDTGPKRDAQGWEQPRTWIDGATTPDDLGLLSRAESDAIIDDVYPFQRTPKWRARDAINAEAGRRILKHSADHRQRNIIASASMNILAVAVWALYDFQKGRISQGELDDIIENSQGSRPTIDTLWSNWQNDIEQIRLASDQMTDECYALSDTRDDLVNNYARFIYQTMPTGPRTIQWPTPQVPPQQRRYGQMRGPGWRRDRHPGRGPR